MPTHDCSTCKVAEECALREIAPWLNEHEDELIIATRETSDRLITTCIFAIKRMPLLMVAKEELIDVVKDAFILGYQKGRVYQDVPEVFKK